MFCWDFKNNLRKIQKLLKLPCLKHVGLENRKICFQLSLQSSVNAHYVDDISGNWHYFAKIIYTIVLQLCE